jgi:hypothetical protein
MKLKMTLFVGTILIIAASCAQAEKTENIEKGGKTACTCGDTCASNGDCKGDCGDNCGSKD